MEKFNQQNQSKILDTVAERADDLTDFVLRNFGTIAFLFLSASFILPVRADLSVKYRGTSFYIENFLWIFLILNSSYSLFLSRTRRRPPKLTLSFLTISLLLLMSLLFHDPGQGILLELDWWIGRCGIIVGIISLISGGSLFHWARSKDGKWARGTGVLAGFASAGLGCLFMQFVCAQDSSNHLMVWHFLPLLAISVISMLLGSVLLSKNTNPL